MALTRRDFLKFGGLAAASLTAGACTTLGREIAQRDLPAALAVPAAAPGSSTVGERGVDPLWRLLNRAGYGPRPSDYEAATALGFAAYLESQLAPEEIEDRAAEMIVRNLDHYNKDISQLVSEDRREVAPDLVVATVSRAVYSRRQLYESMVEFWSDHFNIYLRKADVMPALKIIDDREVIRRHALGNFRDLLYGSAQSPAMLLYLDNVRNARGQPNENYARELLELHTLGVHAGYTQEDVQEVARAFTGWGVQRRRGNFEFRQGRHDEGEKVVLGRTLPAGRGQEDGFDVLEMLLAHPATAEFIATKLVRRFVADEPPAALVARVAETFRDTDGDIKSMLRVIFLSDEFAAAPPKLKRPYTYLVSALRAVHADVRNIRNLGRWFERLGQLPFTWPAPDGYPDVAGAWANNLLPRWNFGLELATGSVDGITVPYEQLARAGTVVDVASGLDLFAGLILGRALSGETGSLFHDFVGRGGFDDARTVARLQDAVGLLLASPAFQWT